MQSLASVVAYCVGIALLVFLGFDKIVYMFFPVDALGSKFEEEVMTNSSSITIMFTIAISGYVPGTFSVFDWLQMDYVLIIFREQIETEYTLF